MPQSLLPSGRPSGGDTAGTSAHLVRVYRRTAEGSILTLHLRVKEAEAFVAADPSNRWMK